MSRPFSPSPPTLTARRILVECDILPGADFFTLSPSQVSRLIEWADTCKYRKPRSAVGSRGRYFYAKLQREAGRVIVEDAKESMSEAFEAQQLRARRLAAGLPADEPPYLSNRCAVCDAPMLGNHYHEGETMKIKVRLYHLSGTYAFTEEYETIELAFSALLSIRRPAIAHPVGTTSGCYDWNPAKEHTLEAFRAGIERCCNDPAEYSRRLFAAGFPVRHIPGTL